MKQSSMPEPGTTNFSLRWRDGAWHLTNHNPNAIVQCYEWDDDTRLANVLRKAVRISAYEKEARA